MEAIAESQELLDGNEAKPYLGSMAAVLLAYDPPQTQAAPAGPSQVGHKATLTVFSLAEPRKLDIMCLCMWGAVGGVKHIVDLLCTLFAAQCNHV